MEYDAQVFKMKANKKARNVWMALSLILSLSYTSDTAKGLHTLPYYAMFMAVCWIPFLFGVVVLRLQGAATQYYKFIVAVGYGVFYAFVVCTSESILSFMYIFPLTSMLVLFKDRTYMVQCGIGTLVISIASSVHKFMNGMNSASNVNDYTLQASCIILCYICYVVSIDHLNESDGALTNSIKADLERVVTTVEQVKGAGNQIMDGVTVVRELEDENRQSSTTVVQGMSELTQNNNVLHDKTMSSMDMTTNINEQVERMASLMEQMVTLMNESADHANESSGELSRVAETTMLMAKLSDEVETILSEFQKEFERVKTEVSTIESINSQTNLLALNASTKPTLVKWPLIIPRIDFGGVSVFIYQMPLWAELTLPRLVRVEGLPAFFPPEMLDTAIWFHHRPIGIQHIVGIERVDVNINAHIIHDTA